MENIQISTKWYCEACNFYFRTRVELYKHRKIIHKLVRGQNIKIEKNCPYCQRFLTTETAYKVHIRS